jgi:hypothetical protein
VPELDGETFKMMIASVSDNRPYATLSHEARWKVITSDRSPLGIARL